MLGTSDENCTWEDNVPFPPTLYKTGDVEFLERVGSSRERIVQIEDFVPYDEEKLED